MYKFLKLSKELVHRIIELVVIVVDAVIDLFNLKSYGNE